MRLARVSLALLAAITAALAAGCPGTDPVGWDGRDPVDLPEDPDSPYDPPSSDPPYADPGEPEPQSNCPAPACVPGVTVDPHGPAVIVTDPEVLAGFSAQKVFSKLAVSASDPFMSADMLIERLFDTLRPAATSLFPEGAHCDAVVDNVSLDAADCDRPEADLVLEGGFFEPGHPNELIPVAIVNRFDLASLGGQECGQYRIVYAMRSGLTDPDRRFFLILEPAVRMLSTCVETCRPIAEAWKSLETQAPAEQAGTLHQIFFEGVGNLPPVLRLEHLQQVPDTDYAGGGGPHGGQLRIAMKRAGEPWAWRQLEYKMFQDEGFRPIALRGLPIAELFDPTSDDPRGPVAREAFLKSSLQALAVKDGSVLQMETPVELDSMESELDGPGRNDYLDQATAAGDLSFFDALQHAIDDTIINETCPPGDYMDAADILRRASMASCAGCHAPDLYLSPGRSVGCGMTWPASNGETHVDEHGELSPALLDVLLPHRAKVLETFLSGCSPELFEGNGTAGDAVPAEGSSAIQKGARAGRSAH